MRRLILTALCLVSPLLAREIPVQLEIVDNPQVIAMGLMGRTSLPENHGMLFVFPRDETRLFWMFNCFMDLDIAGLDGLGTVGKIQTMRAYPEMMDPRRPVRCVEDLANYPSSDPICRFYQQHGTEVSGRYVVEMEAGWFEAHGVEPGWRLRWNSSTGEGLFISD